MRLLLLVFILVPIIEIGVFIQVGGLLGAIPTIAIVIATAVVGVNLLKQQGLRAWTDIQLSISQGQMPALEMAGAAQIVLAGALLLTPGFVTDIIGFLLMVPHIRNLIAVQMLRRWQVRGVAANNSFSHSSNEADGAMFTDDSKADSSKAPAGRIVEGEFEDRSR